MSQIYTTVRNHAISTPQKVALVTDQGEEISYRGLLTAVDHRIQQLQEVVVPGQSRVAFSLHEGVQIPVTVLALNYLGVAVIPLNPTLKPVQIATLLQAVDATVLVMEPATALPAGQLDNSIKQVQLESPLFTQPIESVDLPNRGEYRERDAFLITLSSGSTGDPKPIIFTEQNKLQRAAQAQQMYRVTKADRILCASPFFHSLGQRLTLLPLLVGATLVQLTQFTANRWASQVEQQQVSFTIPVSSHLHELVSLLIEQPKRFASLRCLVSSSAAIADDVKQRLFDALSCDFHEMYGASEVATATDLNREQAQQHPRSVGYPCPEDLLKIVNDRREVLAAGEIGEIAVSSPLASPGYYQLPEVIKDSFVDGYFFTGDLGYLDDEGYLYFVNRKKEMIVTGGMNIFPSDIEMVLNVHSFIEAVVIGIHDSYLGEVPVAVIVTEEDERTVEQELRKAVREILSPYQHPMRYFFREQLPMTASGKVDKLALQTELNQLGLDLSAKLRLLQN